MELLLPLLIVVVALVALLCTVLLCHGLDPLRLLRSSFKLPRLHLPSLAASGSEREALLANGRKARIRFTGKVPLYTDTIAALTDCTSPRDVEALIDTISVHRLLNSATKAQHFAHFCGATLELAAFSTRVLATLIAALQPFAARDDVAQCIAECFRVTHGAATFELKNEVERRVSLYRVVYHRIRSTRIRNTIIEHLEAQAQAHALQQVAGFRRPTKLVCDIDDTLLSVLFDTRYPELTVYPGVHQFVHEVQRLAVSAADVERQPSDSNDSDGNDNDDDTSDSAAAQLQRARRLTKHQRVTFLTARPELLRARSTRELRACGFANFTLLMGRLSNVMGSRRIASGKLQNFTRFKRLFAEHQFIFVGDNGQGDIDLGKALLRDPALYSCSAVLIHDVIRNHAPGRPVPAPASVPALDPSTDLPSRQSALLVATDAQPSYRWRECATHDITMFRTYIGASFRLFALGLLPLGAVVRVVEKTVGAFYAIAFDSVVQKRNIADEIMNDVVAVAAQLPSHEAIALVAMLRDDFVTNASATAMPPESVV